MGTRQFDAAVRFKEKILSCGAVSIGDVHSVVRARPAVTTFGGVGVMYQSQLVGSGIHNERISAIGSGNRVLGLSACIGQPEQSPSSTHIVWQVRGAVAVEIQVKGASDGGNAASHYVNCAAAPVGDDEFQFAVAIQIPSGNVGWLQSSEADLIIPPFSEKSIA
jgi:hypothetical protein